LRALRNQPFTCWFNLNQATTVEQDKQWAAELMRQLGSIALSPACGWHSLPNSRLIGTILLGISFPIPDFSDPIIQTQPYPDWH
jgi:hypothetical protein